MKSKEKIFISILIISLLLLILIPVKSNAALQANGKTSASAKNLTQWHTQIRQMESQGGTLGLNGSSALTGQVTDNVNLDIHMQKNTEYGAMAILSASSYGNPNKIPNGGTTTGNKSGAYMYFNGEWTAATAVSRGDWLWSFWNASPKYKNQYTDDYNNPVPKIGDATIETKGWHGSTGYGWITNDLWLGFVRAYTGHNSIFSYTADYHGGSSGIGYYTTGHHCRAVVVVGERILA